MPTLWGPGEPKRYCDGRSRRSFLQIGGLAMGGLSLPALLQAEALGAVRHSSGAGGSSHKSVIMIYLSGGLAHQDTFGLKPNGPAEDWAIEGGTPSVLFRRGFTKQALLPGTVINIDGYQAKDGSHRANGRNLTLPNGKMLFLGSSGTGAPNELTTENQKK